MKKYQIIATGITIGFFGFAATCGNEATDNKASTLPEGFAFINRANMDTNVRPGDNFFEYANGTWLKNTNIPADKTRWGSFDELRDRTDSAVYLVLQSAKTNSKDVKESNVANFFASGMDSVYINNQGLKAIQEQLKEIENISNKEQLLDVIIANMKRGLNSVIGMYIGPDEKDVNNIVVNFYQTGLGLPNKDYYTQKDDKSLEYQKEYRNYIAEILKKTGQEPELANKNADNIYNIENKLANASLRPQEMRDPQKMYNKYHIDAFSKKTPQLNWQSLFEKLGIQNQDSLIVGTPDYYVALGKMIASTPLDDWKNYLTFHLINDMSTYIGDEFEKASFAFYGQKLRGQKEQEPRWKRVTKTINAMIGEQLGQLYVDKNFKPEAKEKMVELVNNLEAAFKERIEALDWMDKTTKAKALLKLESFVRKIGYPDKWKDYSGLKITKENYAQNVLRSQEFEYNYQLKKLGNPVDKTEWFMTPNTVNAYYNPSFNEIVFPAAILQFPFFDFEADDAINYGGIGSVIGHEMTHGFDDQGAQYAADGNLSNWWTPEDEKKFKQKTQVLVKQYNNFKILDTVAVNGELTLGENIADLGGVAIAYQAFKKTKQGQSNELIDGFTPDQRFFLSWAQIWRSKSTPETALQLIKTDPHSPSEARANMPLANFTPFYEAFNVKEGDKMWIPENERAKIW